MQETRRIAIQLKSGAIPVPLTPIAETTVDATLGQDSLDKSLRAGLVGLGLVLAFMVVYYRAPGVVAAVALLVYASILLAVFKMLPVTLTLSGLAGVILSIGMAVDANVLIFERVKEELRTGRTLASSMEVGFRRAWTAIFDGNVSTLITCAILWWLGSRVGGPAGNGLLHCLGHRRSRQHVHRRHRQPEPVATHGPDPVGPQYRSVYARRAHASCRGR